MIWIWIYYFKNIEVFFSRYNIDNESIMIVNEKNYINPPYIMEKWSHRSTRTNEYYFIEDINGSPRGSDIAPEHSSKKKRPKWPCQRTRIFFGRDAWAFRKGNRQQAGSYFKYVHIFPRVIYLGHTRKRLSIWTTTLKGRETMSLTDVQEQAR